MGGCLQTESNQDRLQTESNQDRKIERILICGWPLACQSLIKIKPPAMRVVHVCPVNLVYIHEWQLKGNKRKRTAATVFIKRQSASLEGNLMEELSLIRSKIPGLPAVADIQVAVDHFN